MWTLDAIYRVLDTRATDVSKRTTTFSEPETGPTAGTMHSLNEIMGLITNRAPVTKTGMINSKVENDDGALKLGVAWPSPRFSTIGASGVETNQIRDKLTGLIWARNANLFGACDWTTAISNCNALAYGGASDWRLPNVCELQSLLDYRRTNPPLPSEYATVFVNVQNASYWTSTYSVSTPSFSYYVAMNTPVTYRQGQTTASYVWPVRGGGW